jgi:hypothetical protein
MQSTHLAHVHKHGKSRLWTIIAIILLCGGLYAGFPVFKVYNAYWIFKENVEELVSFAVENVKSEQQQQITGQINEMLDSMNVQYDQEDVDVAVDSGIEKVTVDVWYTQTINVPLFPSPKRFHVHAQSIGTVG